MGAEEVRVSTQTLEINGSPAISKFVDYFNWRIAYEIPKVVRVANVGEEFKIIEEDGTFTRGTKNDLLLNIDGVLSLVHWKKFSEKFESTGYSFSLKRERLIDEIDFKLDELSKIVEPSRGKDIREIKEMLEEVRL